MKITMELSDIIINEAINNAINKAMDNYPVQEMIATAIAKNVFNRFEKAGKDGSIIAKVASNISETISISEVLKLIDVNDLQKKVSERVAINLLNKINQ